METSTLDGEKHLKQRESLESIRSKLKVTDALDQNGNSTFTLSMDMNFKLFVQHPNASLYNFEGFVDFSDNSTNLPKQTDSVYEMYNLDQDKAQPQLSKQSLDTKNFIFKGSKIRNTTWILGIVLYTGTDTKIQQNSLRVRNKVSHLEQRMSIIIISLFGFQLVLALIPIIWRAIQFGSVRKSSACPPLTFRIEEFSELDRF